MIGESSSAPSNRSSSMLQVLIFLSWHFMFFFFILNLCLFTYKSVSYYYPGYYLGWEIFSIFMYLFLEYCRLLFLSKGNKTITSANLAWSIFFSIPIFVLYGYYLDLQTYVLRVDIVINSVGFFFLIAETLGAMFMLLKMNFSSVKF